MSSHSDKYLSRRALLGGAGFLALASVIPLSKTIFDSADAATTTFSEPKKIFSADGVLKVTLDAAPAMVPFNSSKRWALLFNKSLPAPTLVAKPGDTLKITVKNSTGFMTNLHTHGLHVSPSGNSDNPFIEVKNGKSFNYEIKIPTNQRSGTFWYHPHHHMAVAEQVNAGLAGAIIILDAIDKRPEFSDSTERTILFSDPKIGTSADSVLSATMMDSMHGRSGQYLLINGARNPLINAKGSKVERWRLVNTCVSRYLDLSIDNADLVVISSDGGRLEKPFTTQSLTMTPGQRYEIAVAPKLAGALIIRDGNTAIGILQAPVNSAAAFLAGGYAKVATLPAPSKTRTITIVGAGGMGGMGMGGMNGHEMSFSFDGVAFDPTTVNQRVKAGAVEDWIIKNTSSMDHPFHIHAWDFQIADRGDGNPVAGWKDTVNIPAGMSVRIRINFADFKGKSVYHCHILDHEDNGMMGIVEVA